MPKSFDVKHMLVLFAVALMMMLPAQHAAAQTQVAASSKTQCWNKQYASEHCAECICRPRCGATKPNVVSSCWTKCMSACTY